MKKFVLIAVLSIFTMSAFAQLDMTKGYSIQSASGYVLDIAGGKTAGGTNIQLWDANGSAAQSWRLLKADGEDTYYFLNPQSGKLMFIKGDKFERGANIVLWWTHCRDSEKFIITPAGDGYYYIKTVKGDLYLAPQYSDVKKGTNVVLWDKSDKARWLLNAH